MAERCLRNTQLMTGRGLSLKSTQLMAERGGILKEHTADDGERF